MAKSKALFNILNMVSAANDEIPIETQFLNDLKNSIELNDRKDARKPSQSYKPSSLHCIRNMYYQVTGTEQDDKRTNCSFIGICESGTDRHERIQNAISRMCENGFDCEYVDVGKYVISHELPDVEVISQQGNETKLFNKRLNISFLCDGIIRYKGKYYIIEIKTESSNKFWARKEVNPDHILQGTAYSLNLKIEDVIFLYECRDSLDKKTYVLHVTDDMRKELEDKINKCTEYVNNKSIPPIPEILGKNTCAYCDYSERCKLDG